MGTVRIVVENPFRRQDDVDFSGLVVTEDLESSGLTYVPGSTRFFGSSIAVPPVVEPTVGPPNGSVLTWDLAASGLVLQGRRGGSGPETLIIEFQVARATRASARSPWSPANRTIERVGRADAELRARRARTRTSGPADACPSTSRCPQIIKRGRNVDAGQGAGRYSDPVYGHEDDDVIWRIQVRNDGHADLQDFKFTTRSCRATSTINYVCDSEADATAAANGAPPARCVALAGTTTRSRTSTCGAAFGSGREPVHRRARRGAAASTTWSAGSRTPATNRVNTVSDVEWGCQVEPPAGRHRRDLERRHRRRFGASQHPVRRERARSSTSTSRASTSPSRWARKGTVTIRIRNHTGGTIKHTRRHPRCAIVLPAGVRGRYRPSRRRWRRRRPTATPTPA